MNEITKQENPGTLMRQATDVAGVCREIVLKTACNISGKKYVKVEGWQAIATAHGCVLSARDVERIEGGIRAIAEVRRIDTGIVIATAEGFLGDDEENWTKRPLYAKRCMAQTRAMSRAARSAFAHVVVLIDGNLSTTPAEEVPDGGFQDHQENPPADGNLHVIEVTIKEGEGKKGPWKNFRVKFSDGREAGTFDTKLGEAAQKFAAEKTPVEIEVKQDGKYLNLISIQEADDIPMNFPEEKSDEPKDAAVFAQINQWMAETQIPESFVMECAIKGKMAEPGATKISDLSAKNMALIISPKYRAKIGQRWNEANDKKAEEEENHY